MIQTNALVKLYDKEAAVQGLTFRVEAGEIFGFLGPNGAGKSTTVKMLTGMLRPTSGSATVAGFDIITQQNEMKKHIGYVPETGMMYESLTAPEYLEFVASLYHMDPAVSEARADEMMNLFDLADAKSKRMSELSKGMKQKVLLASALIHNPDVLFLDEPLNGLDPNAAMIVKELLKRLAGQGKAVFLCSHILEVVERVCTRMVIINKGQIISQGTAAEILEQTECATLEEAFNRLTGMRSARDISSELLEALEKV